MALVAEADAAFDEMRADHGTAIRCKAGCSDCCHAVFGLFPIEAAVLKERFDALPRGERRAALQRCGKADRAFARLRQKWTAVGADPGTNGSDPARERIPCPLLAEDERCILYSHRPVTCRVYGIPTLIRGKVRVCGKSGFRQGTAYPVFDLDAAYARLHALSRELLADMGAKAPGKASLLFAVSRVIRSPLQDLLEAAPA
jgi:Fe-S-cluster containining protein